MNDGGVNFLPFAYRPFIPLRYLLSIHSFVTYSSIRALNNFFDHSFIHSSFIVVPSSFIPHMVLLIYSFISPFIYHWSSTHPSTYSASVHCWLLVNLLISHLLIHPLAVRPSIVSHTFIHLGNSFTQALPMYSFCIPTCSRSSSFIHLFIDSVINVLSHSAIAQSVVHFPYHWSTFSWAVTQSITVMPVIATSPVPVDGVQLSLQGLG